MESLRALADRLDDAAGTLTVAGRELVDGPPPVLGGDGPGRLTESSRALAELWLAATAARAGEAAFAADRLTDLAASLRVVAAGYSDTDDTARRRHAEEA